MRILLAEDNAVMAKVLSFNLSRAGFDVCVSTNGRKALEAARLETFSLLITDYQMPEMRTKIEWRRIVSPDSTTARVPSHTGHFMFGQGV